ncbi:MAG: mismatch-specific DNA-glycosylase [Dehalococcoidia bacterium]
MQGRRTFTNTELAEIKKLLVQNQRASRSRQKAIRQAIRNKGFFISDFSSSGGGFGPRDLDRLIETGQIQMADSESSSEGVRSWASVRRPSIWERLRAWVKELLSRGSHPERRDDPPSFDPKPSHRGGTLEPLLREGLDVVFVGTEPGPTSLRLGVYYANPDNTFYRDLRAAGFTSREFQPGEYRALLDEGIGLDDVYDDPLALRRRLLDAAPRAVCFNSKGALQRLADDLDGWDGSAAGGYVKLGDALIWAVPDSSPRASRFHERRVRLLKQLHDELRK